MIIIDGKKVASDIRAELKLKIDELLSEKKVVPGLVTILVGEDPASKVYVKMKHKACNEVGINSKAEVLDANITEDQLLKLIGLDNGPCKIMVIRCFRF